MPNAISGSSTDSEINSVATLMYSCGVSVSMDYGTASSWGSIAFTTGGLEYQSADYALKTYFGYDTTLNGIYRSNYSYSTWMDTIEKELKAGRPVIYRGTGNGGGHCFVADGYDNQNYLHFTF